MEVTVREATLADVELVAAMRLAFLADHRAVVPADLGADFADRTRAFVGDRHERGAMRSWLAEDDRTGACVGAVSMLLLDLPPRPEETRTLEGYVLHLYVAPDHRGQGVGRQLFDACLTAAASGDVRRLFLHATDDGRPLYADAGFRSNDDWLELRLPR